MPRQGDKQATKYVRARNMGRARLQHALIFIQWLSKFPEFRRFAIIPAFGS
jgi:hypothetical protein